MKYFLIAGERSGDLHGSFLIKQLLNYDADAQLTGYGGDKMEKAGMKLISHYQEISFMGFLEVIRNLRVITQKIRQCKQAILNFQPDVLILIDFPGFNLRMARFAHSHQFKVAYYIAPKAWAWKENRVKAIKQHVDRLYSILPFEVPFFQKHDHVITYVGNPVVEEIREHDFGHLPIRTTSGPKIAYLPGSRVQEVITSINMIVACARLRPEYHFLIAGVDNVDASHYQPLNKLPNVEFFLGKTYEILKISDAAVVTSGTATLETAILNVPQVVCYKTSKLSYWIARALIKVRFLSLVNLILDKKVVQEFIQDQYTPEIILKEIDRLLEDDSYRQQMLLNYLDVSKQIGDHSASKNVAENLTNWIKD